MSFQRLPSFLWVSLLATSACFGGPTSDFPASLAGGGVDGGQSGEGGGTGGGTGTAGATGTGAPTVGDSDGGAALDAASEAGTSDAAPSDGGNTDGGDAGDALECRSNFLSPDANLCGGVLCDLSTSEADTLLAAGPCADEILRTCDGRFHGTTQQCARFTAEDADVIAGTKPWQTRFVECTEAQEITKGAAAECLGCFGREGQCLETRCATECAGEDISTEACDICRHSQGCFKEMRRCLGGARCTGSADTATLGASSNASLECEASACGELASSGASSPDVAHADVAHCLGEDTDVAKGLSAECRDCFGDYERCGREHCTDIASLGDPPCSDDPTDVFSECATPAARPALCDTCRRDHCEAAFEACSGLDL